MVAVPLPWTLAGRCGSDRTRRCHRGLWRGAALGTSHDRCAQDFVERHLGFSPDNGDGSMEVLLLTVLVMIITTAAFRWAFK